MLKRILAGVVVALTLTAAAAAGPLEDVRAAYDRGDYATALRLLRPFAEQGNAVAQYNLGLIYLGREGVPRNEIGDALVLAHMWLNLAAAQGNKDAKESLDAIAADMPADQLAEAQRLARDWQPGEAVRGSGDPLKGLNICRHDPKKCKG